MLIEANLLVGLAADGSVYRSGARGVAPAVEAIRKSDKDSQGSTGAVREGYVTLRVSPYRSWPIFVVAGPGPAGRVVPALLAVSNCSRASQ